MSKDAALTWFLSLSLFLGFGAWDLLIQLLIYFLVNFIFSLSS